MWQYFMEQLNTSSEFLIRATKLGSEIFEYDNENKFKYLMAKIGDDLFQQIKPELVNFINAKNNAER